MRRFNILLLLIISVILCSTKSQAQMQSVINTSTYRSIASSNTVFPAKSIAISPTKIISAGNYSPNVLLSPMVAVFCLTDNDSNNNPNYPNCGANTGVLSNFPVSDMTLYQDEVFFCGNISNSQTDTAYFAHTYWEKLVTGGNIEMFSFPKQEVNIVSKIDAYDNDIGENKVSLIGVDTIHHRSLFIDVNLSISQCEIYAFDSRRVKLLDVSHNAKHVVVLGQLENGIFALLSHDKNDLHNYVGQIYHTPQLYLDDTLGHYHYLLEMFKPNDMDVAIVGYSAMDDMSGTTISMINLYNMDVMQTQAVDQFNEARSNFKYMKMDFANKELLCLITNPITGFNNNIFTLRPLIPNDYYTEVAIPDGHHNADYFTSLVPYKGEPFYMALGKFFSGKILFFDKRQYDFSDLTCMEKAHFDVKIIKEIKKMEQINYDLLYPIPYSHSQVSSFPIISNYTIECQ